MVTRADGGGAGPHSDLGELVQRHHLAGVQQQRRQHRPLLARRTGTTAPPRRTISGPSRQNSIPVAIGFPLSVIETVTSPH